MKIRAFIRLEKSFHILAKNLEFFLSSHFYRYNTLYQLPIPHPLNRYQAVDYWESLII